MSCVAPARVGSSAQCVRRCRPLMGSYAELTLTADLPRSELLALSQTLFAELDRLDAKFSFHRCDSALSALNRRAAAALPADLDDETAALLRQALRFSAATAGRFDMCVASDLVALGHLPAHVGTVAPGASWRDLAVQGNRLHVGRAALLDLGGIAKGYAVDRVIARVPEGVSATVNLGGDLRMTEWRSVSVDLRGPGLDACAASRMWASAVATSVAAPGAQLGVLVDPRSGQTGDEAASYSVFADDAMTADALTKAAMLGLDRDDLWRAGARALLRIDAAGGVQCWRAQHEPAQELGSARMASTTGLR